MKKRRYTKPSRRMLMKERQLCSVRLSQGLAMPKRFDLKQACKDCPFRANNVGFLGAARMAQITRGLLYNNEWFGCHKTLAHTKTRIDWHTQHCAGAMAFVKANGNNARTANAVYQIAERMGLVDLNTIDQSAIITDEVVLIMHHSFDEER